MRIEPLEILRNTARYLLIGLTVLYLLDWGIFAVRRMQGTALGSVPVEQYLQTPLKGNKAEYDYMGTADQPCSRTLFPQYASQQWNVPCWWLARHNAQWQ
ncbi:MAG: hypothetical protein WAL71_16170 [Terriglobales bacterium]|jgi:hypothetical protein